MASTFSEFQKLGFNLTEKELLAAEKIVMAEYTAAAQSIGLQLQKQYAKLAGVSPENYYNEMLKFGRLKYMLKQVHDDYIKHSLAAGRTISASLKKAMSDNYYRQQFATSWAAVPAKYVVLPESLIELSVLGTEDSFKAVKNAVNDKFGKSLLYQPKAGSLSALLAGERTAEVKKIQKAITSGLINGKGYAETVKDIKNICGVVKNGKITGGKANAMRILRTESTRILNSAAFANGKQLEAQGVDVYKQWVATLDSSTRDRHQALDGQKRAMDETFDQDGDHAMYPGEFGSVAMNVNCRCTHNEIIPGLEPDIRIGRDPVTGKNAVFGYKNYPEWKKNNFK